MNTKTQLYLALRDILSQIDKQEREEPQTVPVIPHSVEMPGRKALQQFELELGPLPDWAESHHLTGEPAVNVQLYTKNGRRNGNGVLSVVTVPPSDECEVYYHVITDMGNEMRLNRYELDSLFEIGDYIMKDYAVAMRKRQNWSDGENRDGM